MDTPGHTIDEALAIADREWRARGIVRRDRAALAADLRLELEAAASDGIAPDQLIGPDLRGFARRVADEAGARRQPREYARLLLTAFAGAVAGAVVGYAALEAVYPIFVAAVDLPQNVHVPLVLAAMAYYGGAAAVGTVCVVAAVLIGMRDVPEIRRTAAAMAVLLPLTGAAITPVVMGYALTTGYSSALPVVLTEIAIVLAALAGATVAARRWALRERGTEPRPALAAHP